MSHQALKKTFKRIEGDFPTSARVWNSMTGDEKGIVLGIACARRNGTDEWRDVGELGPGEYLIDFNFGMDAGFNAPDEFEEIFAEGDGAVVVFVAPDVRDVDFTVSPGRRGFKMGNESAVGAVG